MGAAPESRASSGPSRRRWAAVALVLAGLLAVWLLSGRDAGRPGDPLTALSDAGRPDGRSLIGPTDEPRCGDGQLDPGEDCEPPGEGLPCEALIPGADGATRCSSECTWELDACWPDEGVCGDGRVDGAELCDDGNTVSGDGCDASCVLEVGGVLVHHDGPAIDARIERALLSSPCREPAVRAGSRRAASRRVAYRLFVCELANGEPVFDLGRIRSALAEVRGALRPAGIELVEGDRLQAPFAAGCRVAVGDASLHVLAAEARHEHLLPLFFVRNAAGGPLPRVGAKGYASFGYGAVLASTETFVLAHELGHAFGLPHTHACFGEAGATECAASGDGFCDTPYDPGPAWMPHRCGSRAAERCGAGCNEGVCSGGAEPDRGNFMSYYAGCQAHFSIDQLDLMACVLDHDLPGLMGADPCGSELCNGVDDDCDGAIDEDEACERRCRPAERLVLGTTRGTTAGRGEAYGGDGYPEGTPDVLFELRPAVQAPYCVTLEAGGAPSGSGVPILAQRAGCEWDAPVLASSWEGPGQPGSPLEVTAGPDRAAWITADGWGRSEGVDYRIRVTLGACVEVDRRLRTPRLMSPSPGARVSADALELRWEPSAEAEAYELRLGHEGDDVRADPTCARCSAQIVDQSSVSLRGVAPDRSVFWTVRALRGDELGPFATPRTFVVSRPPGEAALSAPRLRSPEEGEQLDTLTERFVWDPVAGADGYQFRLGIAPTNLTDEVCDACLAESVAALEHVPTARVLAPGYTYEWTARAWTGAGEVGPFARPRRFEIEGNVCTAVGRLTLPGEEQAVSQPDGFDDFTSACGGGSTAEHVWLVVPERDGALCFDTEGSELDTVLSVRERCELPESELACNDEGFEEREGASRLDVMGSAEQPLFVVVDGYGPEDAGAYRLRVREGPCR